MFVLLFIVINILELVKTYLFKHKNGLKIDDINYPEEF